MDRLPATEGTVNNVQKVYEFKMMSSTERMNHEFLYMMMPNNDTASSSFYINGSYKALSLQLIQDTARENNVRFRIRDVYLPDIFKRRKVRCIMCLVLTECTIANSV